MGKHALALAALMACATSAMAWHIEGYVLCDNGDGVQGPGDTPLAGVRVCVTGQDVTFSECAVTDADGRYYLELLHVTGNYCAVIDPASVPNSAAVIAPAQPYCFLSSPLKWVEEVDWLIDHEACASACWMTAGGVKFEPVCGEELAEGKNNKGPTDSFGGNVYPSCSAFPGNGGHWNHVAHSLNLHLNGQDQHVIKCGNVPGTEPGTDSPVCTVNFIHWEGWGTISSIKGADTEKKTPVYYVAKVEDRAEPGNLKGAKNQPDDVDRYFIAVYYLNPDGTPGALVPGFQFGTYDNPIQITGGNLQIHCTSCD